MIIRVRPTSSRFLSIRKNAFASSCHPESSCPGLNSSTLTALYLYKRDASFIGDVTLLPLAVVGLIGRIHHACQNSRFPVLTARVWWVEII